MIYFLKCSRYIGGLILLATFSSSCGNNSSLANEIEDLRTIYQDTVFWDKGYQLAKEEKWEELSLHFESRIEELACYEPNSNCIRLLLHLSGSRAKEGRIAEAEFLLGELEKKLLCGTPDEKPLCDLVRMRKSNLGGQEE